jgi:hypothetical protein
MSRSNQPSSSVDEPLNAGRLAFISALVEKPATAVVGPDLVPRGDHGPGLRVGLDSAVRTRTVDTRGPTECATDLRWSWRSDSNRRPAVYKTAALPTELRQRAPDCTGQSPNGEGRLRPPTRLGHVWGTLGRIQLSMLEVSGAGRIFVSRRGLPPMRRLRPASCLPRSLRHVLPLRPAQRLRPRSRAERRGQPPAPGPGARGELDPLDLRGRAASSRRRVT